MCSIRWLDYKMMSCKNDYQQHTFLFLISISVFILLRLMAYNLGLGICKVLRISYFLFSSFYLDLLVHLYFKGNIIVLVWMYFMALWFLFVSNNVQYWSLLNWHNLRLHCGCVAVPVNWFLTLFHYFLLNLRTLYIVWSLVRRRVTRRLTRLQTMCNALKYRKIL